MAFLATILSVLIHCGIDYVAAYTDPKNRGGGEQINRKLSFRWRNSLISLSHATITGIGAMLALYLDAYLSEDLIYRSNAFTRTLVEYSLGYFIMDSFHMLYWSPTRATYELLIHHVVIITCFSSAILSKKYIGYAVVALLVEINTIFLHLRKIAKYIEISKDIPLYRFITVGNVGTFIICRFLVMSWMTRWLVVNRESIPLGFYCLGAIGLAVVMVMNIVLFSRLIYSDFLDNPKAAEAASLVASTRQHSSVANETTNSGSTSRLT